MTRKRTIISPIIVIATSIGAASWRSPGRRPTTHRRATLVAMAILTTATMAAACGGNDATGAGAPSTDATPTSQASGPVIDPGDNGYYQVTIDPERFSSVVDNTYLPKLPGMRWEYIQVTSNGEFETIEVEVLDERRTVMGVETIIVRDIVTEADGTVIEETYDWFAQDDDGNVWYFGEDTTAYSDGVASKAGAWEAGVDDALPGIVMPGDPRVSTTGYRQEYLADEAEDMGQVIEVGAAIAVPAGSYDGVVRTRDWTPLEAGAVEEKAFAPEVGWIHESKTEPDGVATIAVLTSFSR